MLCTIIGQWRESNTLKFYLTLALCGKRVLSIAALPLCMQVRLTPQDWLAGLE